MLALLPYKEGSQIEVDRELRPCKWGFPKLGVPDYWSPYFRESCCLGLHFGGRAYFRKPPKRVVVRVTWHINRDPRLQRFCLGLQMYPKPQTLNPKP